MKAPGLKAKRCAASKSAIAKTRSHASFMRTQREQANPTDMRRLCESRSVYFLQRVGSEAARLSCSSRRGVMTRREILEAWDQLRRRRSPAALAGA